MYIRNWIQFFFISNKKPYGIIRILALINLCYPVKSFPYNRTKNIKFCWPYWNLVSSIIMNNSKYSVFSFIIERASDISASVCSTKSRKLIKLQSVLRGINWSSVPESINSTALCCANNGGFPDNPKRHSGPTPFFSHSA